MKEMTCTSCGAPLEIENQFIRAVTCSYCGSNYVVSGGDTLSEQGKSTSLGDYPSRLNVGARCKIKSRLCRVIGRIRYAYDEGFWEEWQIAWDDGAPPDWLEEDEGLWMLYRRGRVRGAIPPYDEVRVGSTIQVNGMDTFITEKRTAEVVGSEGQFSSVFPIQGKFGYVTGAANNQSASVNYWQEEIELSLGEDIAHNEIEIL